KQLSEIIDTCDQVYGFEPDAEISIEANPGTIDVADLQILRDSGLNRISFGIQSFLEQDLLELDRAHNSAEGMRAVENARHAGFDNISLDLMYGLPSQSPEAWQQNLEQAFTCEPEHLSLYQLTIEKETEFYRRLQKNQLALPDEDAIVEMDEVTELLCEKHAFSRYEISNYAKPGFRCRHNLVYWHNEEYLACGAGAVGYAEGIRSKSVEDPLSYCVKIEQEKDVIVQREKLDCEASFRESVVIGLRLVKGVSEHRLFERYGISLAEVYGTHLPKLVQGGFLEYSHGYLRLTPRGFRVANTVMAELV
ncbi:MAG: radical SAM family heme chaperone HemW, partial [Deltaproteobacteria bacterium]|nr:radical SAM family heme chaperone HemW [Deltaproteobacteria bacterium]